MNLLKFAGVVTDGPDAHASIDRQINRILAVGARARMRLRNSLRTDPASAVTICKALGCEQGDCGTDVPAPLASKISLVPKVVEKIVQAEAAEKKPHHVPPETA